MLRSTTRIFYRSTKRKRSSTGPDLFDWARERDQLADPAIRRMLLHSPGSLAIAALRTELAGLGQEIDHD